MNQLDDDDNIVVDNNIFVDDDDSFVEVGYYPELDSSARSTPQPESDAASKPQTPAPTYNAEGEELISWRRYLKEISDKEPNINNEPNINREVIESVHTAAEEAQEIDESIAIAAHLLGVDAVVFSERAKKLESWLDHIDRKAEEHGNSAIAAVTGLASSMAQNTKEQAQNLAVQAFGVEFVAGFSAIAARGLAAITEPEEPELNRVAIVSSGTTTLQYTMDGMT